MGLALRRNRLEEVPVFGTVREPAWTCGWQYQSWIFLRDTDFATKAAKVLDPYARMWDGSRLTDSEY